MIAYKKVPTIMKGYVHGFAGNIYIPETVPVDPFEILVRKIKLLKNKLNERITKR